MTYGLRSRGGPEKPQGPFAALRDKVEARLWGGHRSGPKALRPGWDPVPLPPRNGPPKNVRPIAGSAQGTLAQRQRTGYTLPCLDSGGLAERLRTGLQIREDRFDSGTHLHHFFQIAPVRRRAVSCAMADLSADAPAIPKLYADFIPLIRTVTRHEGQGHHLDPVIEQLACFLQLGLAMDRALGL